MESKKILYLMTLKRIKIINEDIAKKVKISKFLEFQTSLGTMNIFELFSDYYFNTFFLNTIKVKILKNQIVRIQRNLRLEKWILKIIKIDNMKKFKTLLKNLPASRAHSHRAQLASLASLSAPRARDLIVALRARSCALRIHLSLFFII